MDHESSPARARRPLSDHVSLSDRDSSLDPDQRAQSVTVPLDPALFPSTSTAIKAQDATAHPIAQSLASKAAPPLVHPSTSASDPPTSASMLPFSGWQWLTLIVLIGCTYTMASAASSSSSPTSSSSTQIRIASWNLRYDSMPNNITVQQTLASLADPLQQPAFFNLTGEQPWSTRRIKVAQRLLSENIVLAGGFLTPRPAYSDRRAHRGLSRPQSHSRTNAVQGSKKDLSDKSTTSQSCWAMAGAGYVYTFRITRASVLPRPITQGIGI